MAKKKSKTIKVSYNIGDHDIAFKKKQIDKFLDKELDVKIEMNLRGRSKYLYDDAQSKLETMFGEYKIINSWTKGNNFYLFINKKK